MSCDLVSTTIPPRDSSDILSLFVQRHGYEITVRSTIDSRAHRLRRAGVALALTKPVSTQGRGTATVVVNGVEAVAGEVLVKFVGALDDGDRQQLDDQIGADQNVEVGSLGVRRIHSGSHDTETLLAFLRTDARVVYAEPNYIVHAVTTPATIHRSHSFGD